MLGLFVDVFGRFDVCWFVFIVVFAWWFCVGGLVMLCVRCLDVNSVGI